MYSKIEKIKREKFADILNIIKHFPDRYDVSHELNQAIDLRDGSENVSLAGRIVSIRKMGKISFLTIADVHANFQLLINRELLDDELYSFFAKYVDIGDFIGARGEIFTTRSGEKTLRVSEYSLLNKSLKSMPEKFHGLSDVDLRQRQRYLDLIANEETRKRFLFRSSFIRETRRYLEERYYIEIETPVLVNKPSGALARPFISHHNALDMDVYLRIAPETYLKRAMVGGVTKVFEFARCFRNEGISPQHLQEFTMLECYCAYYNYKDTMIFIKELLIHVILNVLGTTKLNIGGNELELDAEWKVISFRDLLLDDTGIDIDVFKTARELRKEIVKHNIDLESETDLKSLGRGNLIDLLYKKASRPKLINPTFLIEHPISLSPLARANDNNVGKTDRFQLIINGAEIVNAYSELVDPIEQYERLSEQAKLNASGDDEAMLMDTDYITAMEYGMPPMAGWGMGIDRIIQVLSDSDNIRDCVLFPIMRPIDKDFNDED